MSKDTRRLRGRTNQTARRALFAKQPLCEICAKMGRISLATQRDHIVAIANGGKETPANTQALCDSCHSNKTLQDLGLSTKVRFGVDGWPIKT